LHIRKIAKLRVNIKIKAGIMKTHTSPPLLENDIFA